MAEGNDSIEFVARYRNWSFSSSISISAATKPKEISDYLVGVREQAELQAFRVLDIDTGELDSFTGRILKGLKGFGSIAEAYQRINSGEAKEELEKVAKGREELKPFIQAYLFRSMLNNLGIEFCLRCAKVQKGDSKNVPEGVALLAKYGSWVAIKKMNVRENTRPEEVSMQLASVRQTTDRKSFEVLGVDTLLLTGYAERATAGMRKSAANMQKIVDLFNSSETKSKASEGAKGNNELEDAARIYILRHMLESSKFFFDVNPETLADMYPGLKIPGRRGRKPKA